MKRLALNDLKTGMVIKCTRHDDLLKIRRVFYNSSKLIECEYLSCDIAHVTIGYNEYKGTLDENEITTQLNEKEIENRLARIEETRPRY